MIDRKGVYRSWSGIGSSQIGQISSRIKPCLVKAEQRFLVEAGECVGAVDTSGPDDRNQLIIEAMSSEALTTPRKSKAKLLIAPAFNPPSGRASASVLTTATVGPAGAGYLRDDGRPLPLLRRAAIGRHALRVAPDADKWAARFERDRMLSHPRRADASGVRRNSRAQGTFRGAAVIVVPAEMARFMDWFRHTAPDGPEPLPALTRAESRTSISSVSTLSRMAMVGSAAQSRRKRSRKAWAIRR